MSKNRYSELRGKLVADAEAMFSAAEAATIFVTKLKKHEFTIQAARKLLIVKDIFDNDTIFKDQVFKIVVEFINKCLEQLRPDYKPQKQKHYEALGVLLRKEAKRNDTTLKRPKNIIRFYDDLVSQLVQPLSDLLPEGALYSSTYSVSLANQIFSFYDGLVKVTEHVENSGFEKLFSHILYAEDDNEDDASDDDMEEAVPPGKYLRYSDILKAIGARFGAVSTAESTNLVHALAVLLNQTSEADALRIKMTTVRLRNLVNAYFPLKTILESHIPFIAGDHPELFEGLHAYLLNAKYEIEDDVTGESDNLGDAERMRDEEYERMKQFEVIRENRIAAIRDGRVAVPGVNFDPFYKPLCRELVITRSMSIPDVLPKKLLRYVMAPVTEATLEDRRYVETIASTASSSSTSGMEETVSIKGGADEDDVIQVRRKVRPAQVILEDEEEEPRPTYKQLIREIVIPTFRKLERSGSYPLAIANLKHDNKKDGLLIITGDNGYLLALSEEKLVLERGASNARTTIDNPRPYDYKRAIKEFTYGLQESLKEALRKAKDEDGDEFVQDDDYLPEIGRDIDELIQEQIEREAANRIRENELLKQKKIIRELEDDKIDKLEEVVYAVAKQDANDYTEVEVKVGKAKKAKVHAPLTLHSETHEIIGLRDRKFDADDPIDYEQWQKEAFNFHKTPHGYFLNHDTGTGKSVTALVVANEFFRGLRNKSMVSDAVLYVVAPVLLIDQWLTGTFDKFAANFPMLVGKDAPTVRLVTSAYFAKHVDPSDLRDDRDIVFIDEAHREFLYNVQGKNNLLSDVLLRTVNAARTFPMTATAINNRFSESAGLLGLALKMTFEQVEKVGEKLDRSQEGYYFGENKAAAEKSIVRLWRCAVSVARDFDREKLGFPTLRPFLPIYCPLSPAEEDAVEQQMAESLSRYNQKREEKFKNNQKDAKVEKEFVKLTSMPDFESAYRQSGNSSRAKREAVLKTLLSHRRWLILRGFYEDFKVPMKVVIYSVYKKRGGGMVASALQAYNKAVAKKEDRINFFNVSDDSVSEEEVRAAVDKYNQRTNEMEVLILSERSAAGLDLKGSTAIILYGPDWHNTVIQQAIGRTARLTSHQDWPKELRTVDVIRLISTPSDILNYMTGEIEDDSIKAHSLGDEKIQATAEEKQKVVSDFRNMLRSAALDLPSNQCTDVGYTSSDLDNLKLARGIEISQKK